MPAFLHRVVTVSKIFEHEETISATKEKTITEKRGWHIGIAELGVAIATGSSVKPEVQVGEEIVLTLSRKASSLKPIKAVT